MGKKANPTLIGAFVVGALALAVAGVVIFGSGRLFRKAYPFVCYFDGNVTGLRIGASVKFKGVEIGSVTRILLKLDQAAQDVHVPVVIEIDKKKLRDAGITGEFGDQRIMGQAIQNGLRARLETESFVTGVLYVYLDYHPDTPAQLISKGGRYQEIPTIPTKLEQLQNAVHDIMARLDQIDFKGMVEQLTRTATSIGSIANSTELRASLSSMDDTMKSIKQLTETLNAKVGPLVASIDTTATSLRKTAEKTVALEEELRDTLTNVKALVDPTSPLAYRLDGTLESLGQASQAVRALAEYLQRNPSSIVVGKPSERSNP